MGRFILAIDNGSQSTKVSVFDGTGRIHATARVGLRPYESPAPGRSVHPDDDVWDSIAEATRLAVERFAGDPAEIVAVGLCTIRFCRAVLDTDGRLVEPMLSWMDARVGLPYEQTDPRAAHVTTSSGYITHRLTGRFRDTSANYQGVWPIDQSTWRWSSDPEAFRATGMPRELLSDLVDPGDLLGEVTAEASRRTGIPAGVPVYATANDKAVEALGAGLRSESDVLLSLGTYIAAMTVGTSPDASSAYWTNFASRPGAYLYESEGIRRGMWTVSWFRSLLEAASGAPGASDASGGSATNRDDALYSVEEELNRGAESLAPGSGGLFAVLDWLAPSDAPYRRGALLGFDGSQGAFHIHRAILEGIAFTMADNAEAMASALDRRFDRVILSGGGSRSELMTQIVADVFGLPVVRAATSDAAGLGAAICAAVGSGLHPDWTTAVDAMVRHTAVVAGSPADRTAYGRLRPVHRDVRSRTAELSRAIVEGMDAPAG